MVTAISSKIFKTLQKNSIVEQIRLRTEPVCASGVNLKVTGCFKMAFTVQDKKVVHPVIVCENLSIPGLIGNDFAKKFGLCYDANTNKCHYKSNLHQKQFARLQKELFLPPQTCTVTNIQSDLEGLQSVDIEIRNCPQICHDELLIDTSLNNASICLLNSSETTLRLPRGTIVGTVEKLDESELTPWNQHEPLSVSRTTPMGNPQLTTPNKKLSLERKQKIDQMAKLQHLSPSLQERYRTLLYKYHQSLSLDDNEIGLCTKGQHRIPMANEQNPIYNSQFPLSQAQKDIIDIKVREWLKIGLVRKAESEFNSSLFCVPKKSDSNSATRWRVVQDFREINAKTLPSNARIPLLSDCLDKIGQNKPSLFSALDMRNGYYQIPLAPEDQYKTAFTVDSHGTQYAWVRCPQGLSYMPASFMRIMNRCFQGLIEKNKVLVYLDDLLTFSSSHEKMLENLEKILQILASAGLLLNLEKCTFAVPKLTYLGYEISSEGYQPDPAKIAAILKCPVPHTLKGLRSYLGMLNFYRNHYKNFSTIIKPMTTLTGSKSGWAGGVLPKTALKAFEKTKRMITSSPILHYANFNETFHLYVDGSLGEVQDRLSGGLGCTLVQFPQNDETKPPKVIAYASRTLSESEKNYSTFLIENLAAVFGMETFAKYLQGRRFVLHTDHRPMTQLKTGSQKRTHLRLLELLATFNFEIRYVKGSEQPADFLSRFMYRIPQNGQMQKNTANSKKVMPQSEIGLINSKTIKAQNSRGIKNHTPETGEVVLQQPDNLAKEHEEQVVLSEDVLRQQQKDDAFIVCLRNFIEQGQSPADPHLKTLVTKFGKECFIKDDLVYRHLEKDNTVPRDVIVAPCHIHVPLIKEAHASKYGGHQKEYKTSARILEQWWFPGMHSQINEYIEKDCAICIRNKGLDKVSHTYLKPLEPTGIFSTVHFDLFGPLMTSSQGKKYVLVIVCSTSKYAAFTAVPSKEPEQIAKVLFDEWITKFGIPNCLISDQGKENKNKLIKHICDLLQIDQRFISVAWPQANAQAEILMKHITKYLKSATSDKPLEWEQHLPALMWAYNTSHNKALNMSPFEYLYGQPARSPLNNISLMNKVFYSDDYASTAFKRLQFARKMADQHNFKYRQDYKMRHDEKVVPHNYQPDMLVYLHQPEKTTCNRKISSNFQGPHVILEVLNDGHNALIQDFKTKKTRLVNVNNLRRYKEIGQKNAELDSQGQNTTQTKNAPNAVLHSDKKILNDATLRRAQYPTFVEFEPEIVIVKDNPLAVPKLLPKVEQSDNFDIIEQLSPEPISIEDGKNEPQPSSSRFLFSPQKLAKNIKTAFQKETMPTAADVKDTALSHFTRAKAKNLDVIIPDEILQIPSRPMERKGPTRRKLD